MSENYNMEIEKIKKLIPESTVIKQLKQDKAFDFIKERAIKKEIEPKTEEIKETETTEA